MKIKFYSILMIMLAIHLTALSMPKTPAPYMWMPTSTGNDHAKYFINLKKPELETRIGYPISTSFMLPGFWTLINYFENSIEYKDKYKYLRIYIGLCDSSITQSSKNNLILVLAPCYDLDYDIGDYFILETPFDENRLSHFKLSNKETAFRWFAAYKKVMPLLGMDPSDSFNHVRRGGPGATSYTISDTRCVTYCAEDLKLLREFVDRNLPATAPKRGGNSIVALGAIDNKGQMHNGKNRYKNRTTLQFSLLDVGNKFLVLEDRIPSMDTNVNNKEKSKCFYDEKKFDPSNDINNGQLCPYYCPNGGS